MNKKWVTITILVVGIILISLYVISSTYSVIIEVLDKDGESEIVNDITIRDLVTNDNGEYNDTYYDALRELDITSEEAIVLIDSVPLNRALDVVLRSVVDYRLHNRNKFSNDKLYNLIVEAVNDDDNISNRLKEKVIDKAKEYIQDISEFMYDIETVNYGENAWFILLCQLLF